MKNGVLGTGVVGQTIARKLADLGHEVRMGARQAGNDKAVAWAKAMTSAGAKASHGAFADAAAFGEVIWNCTNGVGALEALRAAGADNLRGKLLIDVTNPLDASKGMPPSLAVCNTDSLGEQIQRAFPDALVVKTLNTVNCGVMVNPGKVAGGDHTAFLSGNDPSAKDLVREIMTGWFGWKHLLDLGDITTARGAEAYLLLWVRLWGAQQTGDFNVKVVR